MLMRVASKVRNTTHETGEGPMSFAAAQRILPMPTISVEKVSQFKPADLNDLCQATEDAIADGIGFQWMTPPMRETLEAYWKGVLVVPERTLYVGRLDGTVAAAIQLIRPSKNKETSAFTSHVEGHFVAPWARGHGLAKALLDAVEREAAKEGYVLLRLSVRETQERALKVYRENGYVEWGSLPYYENVGGRILAGHFFYKKLEPVTDLV
jgi:ribosomal protein S18 acetylase RimI-like enzyme